MTAYYTLTIGIPTWNRYQYLKDNIERLLAEIAKVPTLSIEIFVSDNASNDETQHYCEKLAQEHAFFCYHRNITNLGANANFQNVLSLSHGDYVWMLGDDDLIAENCLSKIIHDIEQHQYPAIIIGGCINDLSQKRLYPPFISHALLTDQTIIQRYDAIQLAGKISCLMFKRSEILPLLPKAWALITTLTSPWPHLIWLLMVLNKETKILFLPYCTNVFIEKNRFNMLQDGISRTNIMIKSYAELIQELYTHGELHKDFYKLLLTSISHGRHSEFLKIVAYTTYMNRYRATLRNAWLVLPILPGLRNKAAFGIFYLLPVLLPTFIRKAVLQLPCHLAPNRQAHKDFIAYLKKAAALIAAKNNTRLVFDKDGL